MQANTVIFENSSLKELPLSNFAYILVFLDIHTNRNPNQKNIFVLGSYEYLERLDSKTRKCFILLG